MVVEPGVYIPDIGVDYPVDDPLFRMRPVKIVRKLNNDASYNYLNDNFFFKLTRNVLYAIVVRGVFNLYVRATMGLKIEGRENMQIDGKPIKGSFVTVANHCFPFDAICVTLATRKKFWYPSLADILMSPPGIFLPFFGAIPLSDGSLSAQKKFTEAFDTLNKRGEAIHLFPEARAWKFYKPVRPFQKGAFTMAYKWNSPIVPMAVTYRERTGIYKLLGKANVPLITLKIGTPIIPDASAPRKTEVDRLRRESHAAICKLAGIVHNPWPYKMDD